MGAKNRTEIAQILIKNERINLSKPHIEFDNLFLYACSIGNEKVISTFLENNIDDDYVQTKDDKKQTGLLIALQEMQQNCIFRKILDIDCAKKDKYMDSIVLLIESNCALHIQDEEGVSPLMKAFLLESEILISKLLTYPEKIGINLQDESGKTALMYSLDFELKFFKT